MSTMEELASFLNSTYLGVSCDRFDNYNKQMDITIKGRTVTSDHIVRKLKIGEAQAKDFFLLLIKGCIISRFGGNSDFSIGTSQASELGIEYLVDGRRLTSSEFDSIFNEANKNFTIEYNNLLNSIKELKSMASTEVKQFQSLSGSLIKNKSELKKLLETNKKLVNVKQLSFRVQIPRSENAERQTINFDEVLEMVKNNNTVGTVEPQIVAALNKIINSASCDVELPSSAILGSDPSKLNDMIINYDILKIVEGRLQSVVDKLSKAIQEQEAEYEKIKGVISEIGKKSVLGITSTEKIGEVISENEVDFESQTEKPQVEVSEFSQKYYNNPFSEKSIPGFRYDHEKNKEEINSINQKQNEQLSDDEKIAINLYKTQLYRAYNNILRYMKQNGLSTEQLVINEEVTSLIKEAYDELYARKDDKPQSLNDLDNSSPNRNLVADNYFATNFSNGIPTFEQYQEMVINYFKPLLSSLSKVTLEDDITVYRGVNSGELDLSGIISTSLSPDIASTFEDRGANTNQKAFIRIRLPKGSPVIMYTNNLLERYPQEYDDNFKEPQKELAFNSELYEVAEYKQSQETVTDQYGNTKNIVYFDVTLRPKVNVLQQEELGGQRS